jgi:hypothetical protein
MTTIVDRELGFRADAINLTECNAHGPRQAHGGPFNSSWEPWQMVSGTFAKHHRVDESQMSRYGVAHEGHN